MRSLSVGTLLLLLAGSVPGGGLLEAQSSMFGVRGLGLPGRSLSPRAIGTAGSFGLFDGESSLNPAAVSVGGTLTASLSLTPEWRRWDTPLGRASLRDTRFPIVSVTSPVRGSRVNLGLSLSGYADRDFRLATADTITLRGAPVAVADTLTSLGGLSDIAFSGSYTPNDHFAVGGAFHIITGSSRLTASRAFADSSFLSTRQSAELSYAGVGFAVGAIRRVGSKLTLAALVRSDLHANVDRDSTRAYSIDLPYTLGAGFVVRPTARLQVAGQMVYRTWSAANSDLLVQGGLGAQNTVDLSVGLEQITKARRPFIRPIRLGVRYAQLPFMVNPGRQPHEVSLSLGSGTRFASDRAGVDVALERAWRSDGSSFKETAWLFTLGISVRP